ncbi:lipocalin family protein [Flavobacterium sp. DG1-102-2]|uniref:lipocalin family protein n=1 Tax=Flavobacterium sp. DG1-102-2 TaxID=3081663 RepID=UPI002949157A|nr:lipocalin family protein [Flavobacterium sp. DG1-102-2]MDV6169912.1 lipocalin family protein [Flavobacterium sp. DG1-102-2]
MKKFLFLSMFVMILASCGSLDQKSQVGIKGNWTISEVTYPGSDYIKVTSFDVADSKCFVGSSWNFVSNNNKGTMNVGGSGSCPSFSSPIVWTVTKAGDFTLKITEGEKAKRVSQGYFLKLRNQTETSFELTDNVSVGGKTVEVVYHFSKV